MTVKPSLRIWIPLSLVAAVSVACAAPPAPPVTNSAARIERLNGSIRLVLGSKAVQRIGIKTEPVVGGADGGTVIPYAALIYDTKGDTFAYTNPAPLTFERQAIQVRGIQGDRVVLAAGPPIGAAVVTVGASQLLGIELGVGQ